MRLRSASILPILVSLAACGGGEGRVTIRGDFADPARAPATVFAVEAERQAEVRHGAFVLRGLSAGPVTLRVVNGADTLGSVALSGLPGGTTVALHRLRVDRVTRRGFPETLELAGPQLVTVNGVRMAPEASLPAEVDARGRVLAVAPERDALLLRPDDGALPDLRVVVGFAAEAVTPDGERVEDPRIRAGDSIRVQGRADHGFVVATRLTVSRRAVAAAPPPPEPASEREQPVSPPSSDVEVRVRLPREVARVIDELDGRGRGHARGRGRGKH